jgi:HK97 family phage prohead protease
MKTKDFALKVDDLSDEGTFTGYGSIFGNLDSYGEVVEPGAFRKSLARHAKEKTFPLMLWQHDPYEPIGVWEDLEEDGKGLKGTGRFVLDTARGKEAHALLKAGAIRGLSIGYREIKVEPDGNNRKLLELDLMEISVVSFPANRRARVETVKSILDGGSLPTVREFEEFLRDAGFSKALATAIAGKATPHLRGEPDGQADLRAFLEKLRA